MLALDACPVSYLLLLVVCILLRVSAYLRGEIELCLTSAVCDLVW